MSRDILIAVNGMGWTVGTVIATALKIRLTSWVSVLNFKSVSSKWVFWKEKKNWFLIQSDLTCFCECSDSQSCLKNHIVCFCSNLVGFQLTVLGSERFIADHAYLFLCSHFRISKSENMSWFQLISLATKMWMRLHFPPFLLHNSEKASD